MASKVSSTQFSHKDFLVGHYANYFFLNPTTPYKVSSIVHSLKNCKCEGVDGLSMQNKETIDLLAAPLSHICNISEICHLSMMFFPINSKLQRFFLFLKAMTLLCSQTITLVLFSPVSLRSSRNFYTSGYQDFSQSSISLIITSTALNLITLLLWLS